MKIERSNQVPVVVDLDGTLLKSDLFFEMLGLYVRAGLPKFRLFVDALVRGRLALKEFLADAVQVDLARLPYDETLIEFLQSQHRDGREVILATASPAKIAIPIADRFAFFARVFGSSDGINLKGKAKAKVLEGNFGTKAFDYIGDSLADRFVFSSAREGYLVRPSWITRIFMGLLNFHPTVIGVSSNSLNAWWRLLRPQQWSKNFLVALPMLASHSFEANTIMSVLAGIVVFSFASSAGYIFNDFLDVGADRQHARKKNRPLADGSVSVTDAVALMVFLAALALAGAQAVGGGLFLAGVLTYLLVSVAYTLFLKSVVILDVFVLGALYTVRIIAGAFLIEVTLSSWILNFSFFIFLSLALAKRYAETASLGARSSAPGRDYGKTDGNLLLAAGVSSGVASALLLALYFDSVTVQLLYQRANLLWLIVPIFLFWVLRLWSSYGRNLASEDPVNHVVKDRWSYVIGLLTLVILVLAK